MSAHTPGPWKFSVGDGGEWWVGDDQEAVIRDSKNEFIAVLAVDPDNFTQEVANARLIAAAPDLLAALKRMIEHGTRAEWSDDVLAQSFKLPVAVIRQARAAIEAVPSAKGEA